MEFAIYKCKQCGEKFAIGVFENESIMHNLGLKKKKCKKKIYHNCDKNIVGIAKFVGIEKRQIETV